MGVVDILKVSLEFSPKLGVRELPKLSADKESNIKGMFVVGDLADAPIIKVAINQGYEVAEKIMKDLGGPGKDESVLDVIVVGAGPAGIGAALRLKEDGANYILLEKERPFNTIQNFPKAKFVFSEPRTIENKGSFWFNDAQKENLIDKWGEEIDKKGLVMQQPEEVLDIKKEDGAFTIKTRVAEAGLMEGHHGSVEHSKEGNALNTYRARRVILAIGRRGSVNKLGIKGEEMLKVSYSLKDPDDHAGRKVLIVGGGDSAVEAAVACANAGAEVTVSYRKDSFSRAKKGNQDQIDALINSGKIRSELGTSPLEVLKDAVILQKGEETIEVPNDDVFVFIGTKLPKPFLDKVGIRFEGQMDFARAVWVISFALMTYLFYVIKQKQQFFPFGKDDFLGFVPDLLKVNLGFREVNGSFWGTVIYAGLILVFGILAYKKYPLREQKKRYISLMVYQIFFLFAIPELIAPLLINQPWKIYAITVPWPLSIWSLIDAPSWSGSFGLAVTWITLGAVTAFVIMPIYVYFNGERFCSYLCGCGGLAETLGDRWRHLAPRGKTAVQAEWFGKIILLLAIPVTLLIVSDAWGFIEDEAWKDTKKFAQHWYGLVVDFWLASVVGVAFYPYLGNRMWCRFFCPLRAYMELLAKWFSRIAIDPNDKCIGCGECTRYCQMGIPVQSFAQKQEQFHNGNSACIQCGICVQVCPMEVLSIGRRGVKIEIEKKKIETPKDEGIWGARMKDHDPNIDLRHG